MGPLETSFRTAVTCEAPEWLGNLDLIKRHFLEDPQKACHEEGPVREVEPPQGTEGSAVGIVSLSMPAGPSWLPLAGYLHCLVTFPLREEVVPSGPSIERPCEFHHGYSSLGSKVCA